MWVDAPGYAFCMESVAADPPEAEPREAATGVPMVKSATRTLEILELLAGRLGQPTRLRDVAEDLHAPRSSTYALLSTLVESGWVRTDSTRTLYTLGIRALLVGTAFIDADPYVRVVRPILLDVSRELNETVHLARLDGPHMVYLVTHGSRKEIRRTSLVGRRLPSHATALGKAVLAHRVDAIPDQLGGLTPNTVTDPDALREELQAVRTRGYATENGESAPGLRCFGFSLNYTQPVTDAISCSLPAERLSDARAEEIVQAMADAQRRIEDAAPLQGTF